VYLYNLANTECAGSLNQQEFGLKTEHFLQYAPTEQILQKRQHLHNTLLGLIFANAFRELPDQGVASWVSATDKPTTTTKAISGDANEMRLKTEVMQLPGRERRRLKDLPEIDKNPQYAAEVQTYQRAKQPSAPVAAPASAGGLNKTSNAP
jgi:transcriptional coactivator HFI1/ADA1